VKILERLIKPDVVATLPKNKKSSCIRAFSLK
jgi:hypothetical protein